MAARYTHDYVAFDRLVVRDAVERGHQWVRERIDEVREPAIRVSAGHQEQQACSEQGRDYHARNRHKQPEHAKRVEPGVGNVFERTAREVTIERDGTRSSLVIALD